MKIAALYSVIVGTALVLPEAPDWPARIAYHTQDASIAEPEASQPFETEPVRPVSLPKTVTATGALNSVINVEVGSQLSGQIASVKVDFNDRVSKGQVLAQLDPSSFEAQVHAAEAALDSARADERISAARLERARIDLRQAQAQREIFVAKVETARIALEVATRESKRKALLQERGVGAATDALDSVSRRDVAATAVREAEANLKIQSVMAEGSAADVQRAQAELDSARASVRRLQSQLAHAQVDLERTSITAPIDGVVVGRNVNQGQTLATSLEARTLFIVAGDLKNMDIYARVDESDITKIAVGQDATFSIDSFPGREFHARVRQVRKAPQVIQNVVTYTVVLAVDNADYALLPGMTAVVKIVTESTPATLTVPLAALRFTPAGGGRAQRGGLPGHAQIWVLRDGAPRPVAVTIGDDDGRLVAVQGPDLRTDDRVVTGLASADRTSAFVR